MRAFKKMGHPQSGSSICQSRVSLMTTQPLQSPFPSPLPISFFPPFFGNPQLQMVSCCYGLWNQFCDWWTYLYVLSVIGWCKCLRIKGVRLQATVQLHHRFHLAMVCFSDMHVKSLSYTVTILTMSGHQ